MLARFRSKWPSCCLIALRILLMRGRFFYCFAEAFGYGHSKELLPCLLALCPGLLAKGLSDLRMHRVIQLLRDFTCLIEKR